MPRQLIYASAARGLAPGQSGYCTVARSRNLREALVPRLEKLSYYTPEAEGNPVICAYRILHLRGEHYHVLTRIVDSGLDFTRRRSFLAHHLVFDANEIRGTNSPAWFFLEWKGWMDSWNGDPRWMEEEPAPEGALGAFEQGRANAWVTGEKPERETFLRRIRTTWGVTFTNCFQPGDNPEDFAIKATWPGTAGYEAARRAGARFIRLDELHFVPASAPAPEAAPAAALAQTNAPPLAPIRESPARFAWGVLAGGAGALVLLVTFFLQYSARRTLPTRPAQPIPAAAPTGALGLNLIFPDKPTWLAVMNRSGEAALGPIPPLENMVNQLRAAELFAKDVQGSIQPILSEPPLPARFEAKLDPFVLRAALTNGLAFDLMPQKASVRVRGSRLENAALEVDGAFRILAVVPDDPVLLPISMVKAGQESAALDVALEFRVRRLVLPATAQLALRPMVAEKAGEWIDPLAALEDDFGLAPATSIDLRAITNQIDRVISEKALRIEELKVERTKLAGQEKTTVTEFKEKERLVALNLAIPKAEEELEALRTKAGRVPRDLTKVERFSLFLCLSNVNSEIIRFGKAP